MHPSSFAGSVTDFTSHHSSRRKIFSLTFKLIYVLKEKSNDCANICILREWRRARSRRGGNVHSRCTAFWLNERFTQRDGGSLTAALTRRCSGCAPLPSSACIPSFLFSNFLESISSGLGPSALAQHSREMMWNRNASNSWSGIHRWVMPVRGPSVDTVKRGSGVSAERHFYICAARSC